MFESEPAGFADQPRFWNAAVAGETRLDPEELLALLKQAERSLGRRERFRNGPREIDLDLLLVGDVELRTGDLELPHPRLELRPFVLLPAAEVAPGLAVPGSGRTLSQLAAGADRAGLVRLVGPGGWADLPA